MSVSQRPLSPHLQVYSWHLTMALSILHRMTGVFLSFGAVALVIVLSSLASGADAYSCVHDALTHPIGLLFLFAWTFALYFHMANGVRHLVWDAGLGLGKKVASSSGWYVLAFAVLATVASWLPMAMGALT